MNTFEELKPGMKLRVRNDLDLNTKYDELSVAEEMLDFRGEMVTIAEFYEWLGCTRARIIEDCRKWAWSPSMFSGVASEPTFRLTDMLKK